MKDIFTFRNFLKNNYYSKEGFNIPKMFKIYSTLSIFNGKDIKQSADGFLEAIRSSFDCINFTSERDSEEFVSDCSEFLADLHVRVQDTEKSKPSYFTKVVSDLAPNKESTKLLDVGAGGVPFSSIILAKYFNDVTSMDKLDLSNQCLARFNVKGKNEYFSDNTDVENYDFIVGKRPCTAIESIVKNASSSNKPYFIELCSCELGKIATREGKFRSWDEILPEYDSDIKFYHKFAFNLDATPEQVGMLLEEHRAPETIIDNGQTEFLLKTIFENHEFFEEVLGLEPCELF